MKPKYLMVIAFLNVIPLLFLHYRHDSELRRLVKEELCLTIVEVADLAFLQASSNFMREAIIISVILFFINLLLCSRYIQLKRWILVPILMLFITFSTTMITGFANNKYRTEQLVLAREKYFENNAIPEYWR